MTVCGTLAVLDDIMHCFSVSFILTGSNVMFLSHVEAADICCSVEFVMPFTRIFLRDT
jgi:hypothetical protein